MLFMAHMDLMGLLLSWKIAALNPFGKWVWPLVPATVCWAVWQEQNNQVFNGYTQLAWQVYKKTNELVVFWAKQCKGFEGVPNRNLAGHWDNVIGSTIT